MTKKKRSESSIDKYFDIWRKDSTDWKNIKIERPTSDRNNNIKKKSPVPNTSDRSVSAGVADRIRFRSSSDDIGSINRLRENLRNKS